jgi:hypothetical protein
MLDPKRLARFACHKVVSAGRIVEIRETVAFGCVPEISYLVIELADGRLEAVKPDAKLFARSKPVLLDYYVVYEDGYVSISPAQAFEEGYTRI